MRDDVMNMKKQNYIGGNWQSALDGNEMEVENPATGKVITSVPASKL